MTKRVTVSLPDDVAAYLDTTANASAAVAAALRSQITRGVATEAMLRAAGFEITEAGKAAARTDLRPLSDQQRAEIGQRHGLLRSGDLPADGAA